MVQSVGKKLQQARLRQQISVEEAARITRMRPDKILDLEEDNYSNFPSMSYAKGFLLMYAKFLGVDVSEFANSLQTPNPVSNDDYEYLNAAAALPAVPPTRRPYSHSFAPRRERSILPLVAVAVLIMIALVVFYLVSISRRLGSLDDTADRTGPALPAASPAIATLLPAAAATPAPVIVSATPAAISAQKAAAATPAPIAAAPVAPVAPVAPAASVAPAMPIPSIPPSPALAYNPSLPVRPAEPVAADTPAAAASPTASPAAVVATVKQVSIQPLRKTRVTIRRDVADSAPVFEDWLYPSDGPLKLRGRKFWIQVQDPGSVQVTQDGAPVPSGQAEIRIE